MCVSIMYSVYSNVQNISKMHMVKSIKTYMYSFIESYKESYTHIAIYRAINKKIYI